MARPRTNPLTHVVFDLGGVLIDWNPRYMYRKLFKGDEQAMEHFLATVCTHDWNLQQDAGRPFKQAIAELCEKHPGQRALIEAWWPGYPDMLAGEIQGTVEILAELRARGTPLYALTNWSAETFPIALARFEFLKWFRGIVVSGDLMMIKPDPRIYRHLIDTHGLSAQNSVFIDDTPPNVAAAAAQGFHAIQFTDPPALRAALRALEFL